MTASSNGKAKSGTNADTFVADTVKTSNDQMVTMMKQSATIALDAASAMFGSLGKLAPSMPPLPGIPFMPTKSGISQLVNVTFDTTENLLSLQRGFVAEVVERFVPASGAR